MIFLRGIWKANPPQVYRTMTVKYMQIYMNIPNVVAKHTAPSFRQLFADEMLTTGESPSVFTVGTRAIW